MSQSLQITRFNEAREAGMTAEQSARWVAYLDLKAGRGEEPIALWEAVLQLDRAKDERHIGRMLREMFTDIRDRLSAEGVGA